MRQMIILDENNVSLNENLVDCKREDFMNVLQYNEKNNISMLY